MKKIGQLTLEYYCNGIFCRAVLPIYQYNYKHFKRTKTVVCVRLPLILSHRSYSSSSPTWRVGVMKGGNPLKISREMAEKFLEGLMEHAYVSVETFELLTYSVTLEERDQSERERLKKKFREFLE